MVWCNHCEEDVEAETYDGASSCAVCGVVLDDAAYSNEVTFTKGADGGTAADGQRVTESGVARGMGSIGGGRNYGSQIESKEKSLMRGRLEIQSLVSQLRIQPAASIAEGSHRLYGLALGKNFTRGRRTAQVAAACIYIMCREEQQPFMLIDFSDALQINVFVLGAVYVQLIQLLRLQDEPAFSRPTDPSLYLDRYAAKLGLEPRARVQAVVSTSLQLVKSMKRDWMQTGRRPAGICGAALFIALHIHGFHKSKADVVRVVNVGVTTLSKRLREFGATDTGELTNAQLKEWDRGVTDEMEQMMGAPQHVALSLVGSADGAASASIGCATDGGDKEKGYTRGCPHIGKGTPPTPAFAHDLCRGCFAEFLNTTGGRHAGALPPAFMKNRKKEEKLRKEEEERQEFELETQSKNPSEKLLLLTAGSTGHDATTSPDDDVADRSTAVPQAAASMSIEQQPQSGAQRVTRSSSRLRPKVVGSLSKRASNAASDDDSVCNSGGTGSSGDDESASPKSNGEPPRQKRRLNSDAPIAKAANLEENSHQADDAKRKGAAGSVAAASTDRSHCQADAHPRRDANPSSSEPLNDEGAKDAAAVAESDDAAGRPCTEVSEPLSHTRQSNAVAGIEERDGVTVATLEGASDGPSSRGYEGQTVGNEAGLGVLPCPLAPAAQRSVHFAPDAVDKEGLQGEVRDSEDTAADKALGTELALVPGNPSSQADGNESELATVETAEEELPPETFSDLDDEEIDTFLLSKEERDLKEQVWTTMNEDWIAKQEAKMEAQAAGEQTQAERQAAADAQIVAAGGDPGAAAPKRTKGRPLGSKTRTADGSEQVSESAGQAAKRMLEHRKLSSKVNYNVLANLFSDVATASSNSSDSPQKGAQKAGSAFPAPPSQPSRRTPGRGVSGGLRNRQPGLLDDITSLGGSSRSNGSRPASRGGFAPRVKR